MLNLKLMSYYKRTTYYVIFNFVMARFLLWTVPWLNLYVDNVWDHGNDHTLYIYINYLYLLNTIQWILVKAPRAQTHRHAQCFSCVEDSCYILFSLFPIASLHTDLSWFKKEQYCISTDVNIYLMTCDKYCSTISKYIWMYAVPK